MCGNLPPQMTSEKAEALLKQRLRSRVIGLRVLIREGGVVLQGTAFSYYAKQLAQEDAMHVLGFVVLANEIEVRPDGYTRPPGGLDPG
jgi:hypothetical protein